MNGGKCARDLILATWLGLVVAASGATARETPGTAVRLPPIAAIDDFAWSPASGGRLLVTSDGASPLEYLDREGKSTGQLFVPLTRIRDVKAMKDGSFVVGDARNGRIYRVREDGSLISSAGARGLSEGQFLQLDRVDADSGGRLFGLDGSELKIMAFTPQGELAGTFPMESGPVVDAKGRLVSVQERASTGVRRLMAFESPKAHEVLFEGKIAPGERWEAVACLSGGDVIVRVLDLSGRCSVLRVAPGGKAGTAFKLSEDALLAGPARVIAVDPSEEKFVYLAGGPGNYRAVWAPLPR